MRYDTIVVGGGTSGCILAARLSEERTRSVVVVEAGPDYALADLPNGLRAFGGAAPAGHTWTYGAVAVRGDRREIPIPRGRVTGGSSAIHMATFLRGTPEDYDGWARAGNGDWSFDAVLPFFRDLEQDAAGGAAHGAAGPVVVSRYPRHDWTPPQVAFEAACRALGLPAAADLNRPGATGVGPLPANRLGGDRVSTATAYLEAARARPNLHLLARTTARRIVFAGDRARGVVVAREDGTERTIEGGEIVLCAGAIGTPHLLLLSGVGPAEELRRAAVAVVADLPGVGRNLQDHPSSRVLWRSASDRPPAPGAPRIQTGARWTSRESGRPNDLLLVPSSFVPPPPGVASAEPSIAIMAVLALPESRGSLTLRSTDPQVPPALQLGLLDDPSDRARMREAVRLCVRLGEQRAFAALLDDRHEPSGSDLDSDAALEAWLLRTVQTAHHVSCTCAMGPVGARESVVDQHGRVHGLRGLRIADASIMPRIVAAPIAATVMMVAERIASFAIHDA